MKLAPRPLLFAAGILLLPAAPAEGVEVVGPSGHATIQAGIDAAAPGERVEVAPGIYVENLTLGGKDVVLVGVDGADATVVDGGAAGPVLHVAGTAVTRGTVVEGFTFRNGLAAAGGGLVIRDGAQPIVRGNVIEHNRASVSGGGIKVSHGAVPEIVSNKIRFNSSGANGAGIHVEGLAQPSTAASIRQNSIRDNAVDANTNSSGGGVKVSFSTASTLIEDNLILDNSVTWAGGGISLFAASAAVRRNTISGNDGGRFAGGVHFEVDQNDSAGGARTFVLEGNEIRGNRASERGGGVHTQGFSTASTITIRDNIVAENTATNPACSSVSCPAASCGKGGGLDAQRGTAQLVEGNEIRDNRADCYGAVLLSGAPLAATFRGNTVQANSGAFNYPGVGCVDLHGCTVSRNRFLGNFREVPRTGAFNPGALDLKGSGSTLVENNHFHGNVGDRAGAVLVREMTTTPKLRNNTFASNSTTEEGGAGGTVRVLESSAGLTVDARLLNNAFVGDVRAISYLTSAANMPALDIRNNSFFGQSAGPTTQHTTVTQLNAETWASGNIAADPGIANATISPRIPPGSSVAGLALGAEAPAHDFFGLPRPSASGFAIGASEPHEACESPLTLELTEQTLTGETVHQACFEILTGPDLDLSSAADVTLRAGERVVLRSGTSVASGATLVIVIDPALAVY